MQSVDRRVEENVNTHQQNLSVCAADKYTASWYNQHKLSAIKNTVSETTPIKSIENGKTRLTYYCKVAQMQYINT